MIWAKIIAQETGQSIPFSLLCKLTRLPERDQSRIIALKQVRTLYHQPDLGPDPRGRKPGLSCNETAAIGNYLDDPAVSLDDKGAP